MKNYKLYFKMDFDAEWEEMDGIYTEEEANDYIDEWQDQAYFKKEEVLNYDKR